jgi:2-dehydro-3-deoxygalactonokinase
MISSNMGLWELPHLIAPAGVEELAAGMRATVLPAVTDRPIWFVPGVKTFSGVVTLENCDQVDMMRGEEVETFGLMAQTQLTGPAIVILPGSHTKFVQLDGNNRITGSITSIAGELLAALTHNTLISNALDKSFAQRIEPEALLSGAKHSRRVGLARACFQVRLLDLFADLTVNQKANFLLGAVLASDLAALANSAAIPQASALPLIIGGSSVTAQGFELLLQAENRKVSRIDDSLMRLASGLGSIAVAKERGLVCP